MLGYSIEFFIEGTRSRTGKLLPPKYGLLGIIVDAASELPNRSPQIVPVSIGYARIVEETSDRYYGKEYQDVARRVPSAT